MTGHAGDDEAVAWACLAALGSIGPAWLRWFDSVGTAREVFDALRRGDSKWFAARARENPAPSELDSKLITWSREASCRDQAAMFELIQRHQIQVLFGTSIPARLQESLDPPAVLFATACQGGVEAETFPPVSVPVVAVVGTRRATPYGLGFAEALGAGLSAAGVSVVSGLALGIDAAAHRGAIQGNGIPLAILGAGHHRPCPARNRAIAAEVRDRGVTWSEVPPGAESAAWRYPARNRLIAAVADVVVVVESAAAGGSMLTVAEALRRDVEVMAVPGPVNRSASAGCIELLRDGAHVCAGADDVLSLLGLVAPGEPPGGGGPAGDAQHTGTNHGPEESLSPDASKLLSELGDSPLAFDTAIERTGFDFGRLAAAAAELEQARLVRSVDGWIEPR